MKDMFPWLMVTIWRRCPSISLIYAYWLYPSLFCKTLTICRYVDEYRSGEWGDHVTLQAAADLVCLIMAFFLLGVMPDYSCFLMFQFCLSFFSRIFCESLYLVYPLNLYVAMDPRFPYSLKIKRWSLVCAATVKIVS